MQGYVSILKEYKKEWNRSVCLFIHMFMYKEAFVLCPKEVITEVKKRDNNWDMEYIEARNKEYL